MLDADALRTSIHACVAAPHPGVIVFGQTIVWIRSPTQASSRVLHQLKSERDTSCCTGDEQRWTRNSGRRHVFLNDLSSFRATNSITHAAGYVLGDKRGTIHLGAPKCERFAQKPSGAVDSMNGTHSVFSDSPSAIDAAQVLIHSEAERTVGTRS